MRREKGEQPAGKESFGILGERKIHIVKRRKGFQKGGGKSFQVEIINNNN